MRTLKVSIPGKEYSIYIEHGLLAQAGKFVKAVCPRARKLAVVTDSNVYPLYGQSLEDSLKAAGFEVRSFTIPAGEQSKCAIMLSKLWEGFMDFGLTRTDAVIALGGGVVGDLAGFAASTTLRGVDLIQIPTTLLAQVDSSVGGKTAIDLEAGKNLAGTFWQPRLVLIDPDTLNTLGNRTFADGMAEVIKYGCIWDKAFFDYLEALPDRVTLMAGIEYILYTCCNAKRHVVAQDELDTGLRMILNFGHTLGHAYELAGNYEKWTHGQAVSAGMCLAAKLGVYLGVTPADVPGRLEKLCAAMGLPTAIPCTGWEYAAAISHDKKSTGADISVILLEELGKAVARKMPRDELLDLIDKL